MFEHPKKICRSNRELCRECTIVCGGGRSFPLLQRTPQDRKKENMRRIFNKATIQNKMRLDKYVYTAKLTLGTTEKKVIRGSGKRNNKERGKPERDKRRNKSTNK